MDEILRELHSKSALWLWSPENEIGRSKLIDEAKQAIWEVVERSLPKELIKLETDKGGFSWEYKLGFNDCISDTTTVLRKAILGEGER